MIHKFDELRAGFTPEQRDRLGQEVLEMNREYVLSQIRSELRDYLANGHGIDFVNFADT